jgi:5-formyltetrahydrofolate cyclo-ligase
VNEATIQEKQLLRAKLRALRAARSDFQIDFSAFLKHELSQRASVASYLSYGTEPESLQLNQLLASQERLYLPILQPDLELRWQKWDGSVSSLAPSLIRPKLLEPSLGSEISSQDLDVILLPALAVDRSGIRLGQGGGSYDRTLAKLKERRPKLIAVIYPNEISTVALPHDELDIRVDGYITSGEFRLFDS